MKNLKRYLMKLQIMNQNGLKLGLKNIWKDGHIRKAIEMGNIGKRLGIKELNL